MLLGFWKSTVFKIKIPEQNSKKLLEPYFEGDNSEFPKSWCALRTQQFIKRLTRIGDLLKPLISG
jgi:hypothetical protein